MKKLILNICIIALVLLGTVGFSAWYIIYQVELNPEKTVGSISKYFDVTQEVVYNGQEQYPTVKSGVTPDFDINTLIYSYKLESESNFTQGKPVNANVYDVMINTTDGRQCKIKFTIKPMDVRLDPPLIELNYVANDYRQWDSMELKLRTLIKFVKNIDNLPVSIEYNIDSMTNGDKTYDKSLNSAYIYGSTYQVNISLNSDNYKIIGDSFIILKYKTVKVGNDFFTIEDALTTPINAGDIVLLGDPSNEKSYVVTSFSKILNKTVYDIDNRRILLPFDHGRSENYIASFKTDSWLGKDENPEVVDYTNIYCGLYIPSDITVNLNGNSNLVVGSIIKFGGEVKRRSVLMNDGTININVGSKLLSYGYTKGKGIICVNAGGEVKDVFRINDWPGGDEAIKLKNNNAFPVLNWSVHNITCDTKVLKNGKYNAMTYIVVSNGLIREHVDNIFIVGDESTTNCLFKPDGGNLNNFILKKTIVDNDNWTKDNQVLTYHNKIIIDGSYIDRPLKITAAKYSFETSTSIAVPISNYDFILINRAKLTLSSSSYILYQNSKFIVEKDANLAVLGSAYIYSLKSSVVTVNGKLYGSGSIATIDSTSQFSGGNPIDTSNSNAEISITNFNVNNCVIKTSSTTWTTINGFAEGYINSSGHVGAFTDGTIYISIGNGQFYFVSATSINKYYIDFNVNGNIKTNTYQSIDNEFMVSSIMLGKENLLHYDFVGWYIDQEYQTPFSKHTFTTNGERLLLYAKFKKRVYEFEYNTYFNDGNKIESIKADLSNLNASFTIDDFTNGKLVITTKASYQDKFFDGWYLGINKDALPIRFLELDLNIFNEYLNIVGIDSNTISLYCEFSDNITYEVVFISNNANEEIKPISTTADIIDISSQSDILLVYNDDLDYEQYFDGWYTRDGVKFISNATSISAHSKNSRLILTAKWFPKKVVSINHRDIGANSSYKYVMSDKTIDLEKCKYNDPYLHFSSVYDNNGIKLDNNIQIIKESVSFDIEYAVDVAISHSGKGAVTVWYNDINLGNSGSHKIIIGSTLRIEIGGYLFNHGSCKLSWCNVPPKIFEGKGSGTTNFDCIISYSVNSMSKRI